MTVHFKLARLTALTLAIATTCISMAIAVIGSHYRAPDDSHRLILASIYCIAAIAVHAIPAISSRTPRPITWLIWTLSFLIVVHGHSVTFVALSEESAELRHSTSRFSRSIEERRDAIERDLAKIQARPVTALARLMARAKSDEQIKALQLELSESQRAVRLQEIRDSLAATVANTVATDPFNAQVTAVTGWSSNTLALIFNVLAAVIFELLGAFFWLEARGVRTAGSGSIPYGFGGNGGNHDYQRRTRDDSSKLALLQDAVARGSCTTRVSDIRKFLRCGQEQAMLLRRQLFHSQIKSVNRPANRGG